MRVSEQVIKTSIQHENDIQVPSQEEVELDWKKSLTEVLSKSHYEMKNDKAWANFSQSMRELCPETTWLSICENSNKEDDTHTIASIQDWLEKLVATEAWPFPEKVILMMEAGKEYKVIFAKGTKLPFIESSEDIICSPWKDNHSVGWKIQKSEPFKINKAGIA